MLTFITSPLIIPGAVDTKTCILFSLLYCSDSPLTKAKVFYGMLNSEVKEAELASEEIELHFRRLCMFATTEIFKFYSTHTAT